MTVQDIVAGTPVKELDSAERTRLISAAQALRPLLESKADEHEARGELSTEVIEALESAGLLKLAAPKRIGGLAQPSGVMAEVAAELAKGCPSTSWVYTIYNSCLWFASKLPEVLQAKIFANGIPRICSPQNGMGQLVPEGDGFRLTGRWSYATGSHHAAFTMVPAMNAEQELVLVVMPMSAVRIENTWLVTGMKGSGSDTVVAEDVQVAASDICPFIEISTTPPTAIAVGDLEATDYWVNYPLLRAKSLGVLVGCAEGLLESIVAKSSGPIIYSTYAHKSDSSAYHYLLGEAAVKIRAARHLVERACRTVDEIADRAEVMSIADRAEFRGEGAFVVRTLSEVVDRLMDLAGSSGFGTTGWAQRYWRDYSAAARHVLFNPQISYETAGRNLLGIEPGIVSPDML
ncbi:acyl-CoA dehydrogenase family protein [Rhodococcus rhodochrous]|uniref:acyl-CoA dehydrogenase family protein n=1 Tax=Rhodococcus rhodochrous TaxID=1829 RepID=UPI0013520F12|nr:acyl-CoA dehydrogenase family protein [Rhodococcus rhodochrous]